VAEFCKRFRTGVGEGTQQGNANPTYPMMVRLVRDGDFANAAGPHSVISY
jgi:hypothetical protein